MGIEVLVEVRAHPDASRGDTDDDVGEGNFLTIFIFCYLERDCFLWLARENAEGRDHSNCSEDR